MSEQSNLAVYVDGEYCVTKNGHRMKTHEIAKELNRKSFLESEVLKLRSQVQSLFNVVDHASKMAEKTLSNVEAVQDIYSVLVGAPTSEWINVDEKPNYPEGLYWVDSSLGVVKAHLVQYPHKKLFQHNNTDEGMTHWGGEVFAVKRFAILIESQPPAIEEGS